MNILVIGGGGREHALVWKLKSSSKIDKIYCAPGNAGISEDAICVSIKSDDINDLLEFAKQNKIDLTIVGPEQPLTMGITDLFLKNRLKIFGPTKQASQLEGSKSYMKEFCIRHNIPTAKAEIFNNPHKAKAYLDKKDFPVVVKADGIAAGKGVIICNNKNEAEKAIDSIMVEHAFGDAGNQIVIEDFLQGEEASFIAISDGENILPLATSQDHKQVFDNDKGPNTGGMGAYSPAPVITDETFSKVIDKIMMPTIKGMADEGRKYVGVLYAGLMIKDNEPYLLEFNCRFGDPETEPIMMRLKSDLLSVILKTIDGSLKDVSLEWDISSAVCVVMASKGYPGKYEKGEKISGLKEVKSLNNVKVFHAGTAKADDNFIVNGGRVIGVTALGSDIKSAIDNVYHAVNKISWKGVHYRKDIGKKAL